MKKLAVLLVAAGFIIPSVYAQEDFTITQKQKINQIVEKYLQDNPEVIMKSLIKLRQKTITKQQEHAKQAVVENSTQILNSKYSPVLGNVKGDITIVEFLDYRCGHCREMSDVLDTLMQKDKNIKIVIKQLPIFSGDSLTAAKTALAVNKQGQFAQIHKQFLSSDALNKDSIDQVLSKNKVNVPLLQTTLKQSWINDEITANMKLAKQLGLMGTPAFIIVESGNAKNNIVLPGTASLEKIKTLVNKVRSAS